MLITFITLFAVASYERESQSCRIHGKTLLAKRKNQLLKNNCKSILKLPKSKNRHSKNWNRNKNWNYWKLIRKCMIHSLHYQHLLLEANSLRYLAIQCCPKARRWSFRITAEAWLDSQRSITFDFRAIYEQSNHKQNNRQKNWKC